MTRNGQPTDANLSAYVDGELPPEDQRALELRLSDSPQDAATVAAYRRIDDAIRSRFGPVLDEPVPEGLASTVAAGGTPAWRQHWRNAAAALVLLVAGGAVGYFARGALDIPQGAGASLVANAVSAHAVYVGEVRHPVEVGAGEEAHLVKWLTKRIGADIRAPALNTSGFTLLGGRLLPWAGEPAAQFMYEDEAGRRLTMYVRRAGPSDNTAFQFAGGQGSDLAAFYWIDQPLAYAIVGEISRDELLIIARAAYDQLN